VFALSFFAVFVLSWSVLFAGSAAAVYTKKTIRSGCKIPQSEWKRPLRFGFASLGLLSTFFAAFARVAARLPRLLLPLASAESSPAQHTVSASETLVVCIKKTHRCTVGQVWGAPYSVLTHVYDQLTKFHIPHPNPMQPQWLGRGVPTQANKSKACIK
jgi:hypothetical protein